MTKTKAEVPERPALTVTMVEPLSYRARTVMEAMPWSKIRIEQIQKMVKVAYS
jgi:hypothetical protein